MASLQQLIIMPRRRRGINNTACHGEDSIHKNYQSQNPRPSSAVYLIMLLHEQKTA